MEIRNKKIAVIAGATGLVGEQLVNLLIAHPTYEKVIAIVRKPLNIISDKLEQQIIDFNAFQGILTGSEADHAYCCLGTTLKSAGSKEKQYQVDHDYVVEFAKACHQGGVNRFSVVSSIGALASSGNFYLRTKGEMERDLKLIPFEALIILQPSLLMGERKEYRAGELFATKMMNILNPLFIGPLKKYRGIRASAVASCMISNTLLEFNGIRTIRSDEIS